MLRSYFYLTFLILGFHSKIFSFAINQTIEDQTPVNEVIQIANLMKGDYLFYSKLQNNIFASATDKNVIKYRFNWNLQESQIFLRAFNLTETGKAFVFQFFLPTTSSLQNISGYAIMGNEIYKIDTILQNSPNIHYAYLKKSKIKSRSKLSDIIYLENLGNIEEKILINNLEVINYKWENHTFYYPLIPLDIVLDRNSILFTNSKDLGLANLKTIDDLINLTKSRRDSKQGIDDLMALETKANFYVTIKNPIDFPEIHIENVEIDNSKFLSSKILQVSKLSDLIELKIELGLKIEPLLSVSKSIDEFIYFKSKINEFRSFNLLSAGLVQDRPFKKFEKRTNVNYLSGNSNTINFRDIKLFELDYSLIKSGKLFQNYLGLSGMELKEFNHFFINERQLFVFKGNFKIGKDVFFPYNVASTLSNIAYKEMFITDLKQVYKLGRFKPYFKKDLKGHIAEPLDVKSAYDYSKLDNSFFIVVTISEETYDDFFKEKEVVTEESFTANSQNSRINHESKSLEEASSRFSIANEIGKSTSEWEDISVNSLAEIKSSFDDDGYEIKKLKRNIDIKSIDKWAIVISNKTYYDEGISDVDFAYNDGNAIINYLTKSLGYIENNIVWIKDATKSKFEELFGNERIQNGLLSSLVSEGDEFLIYYSGHGSPGGPQDSEPYLVPVDCSSNFVSISGFPLEVFYRNINQIKAKKKTIILDACFSGKDVIKNVSSVGIKVKSQPFIEDPNTFIFTSSKSEEVSNWFVEKENSLFTYYFLKSINEFSKTDFNKDGELSYQEIYNSLMDKSFGLPYATRRLNQPIQTPQLLTAGNPSTSFF